MELQVSPAQMQSIVQNGKVPPHIAKMAKEYESVFLQTSFKAMFGEMMDGVGETGAGSATWQSMMVEEYANTVADAGGIGLADALARDMLRYQEIGQ
ncbi:MAG: rod-binding protein [Pseudomonadota bacterium]